MITLLVMIIKFVVNVMLFIVLFPFRAVKGIVNWMKNG